MTNPVDMIKYTPVSDAHRAAALVMLVSQEPESERVGRIATIAAALRCGKLPENTLLAAIRGEQLVGVTWGQILPGKTALVWPPRVVEGEGEEIAYQLLLHLENELPPAGIRMAQAVLTDGSNPDARRLLRAGYTHAADLLYLLCQLERCEASSTGLEIDFVPYDDKQRSRLAGLVERTYVNTLDVPALDGIRDINDVLRGYEQTGEFVADRWFFIQRQGTDVGCLLLNDHPAEQQWELVYLGIVPEARGHGWGEQATRFAQSLARRAGRKRLILAVDATNDPAVSAYTKAGFFEVLRRSVFLKIFAV